MNRKLGICSLILAIIGLGVLFIYMTGCKKTCCTIGFVLSTDSVVAITETTALCGGTIASDDEDTVTARGVCWSTRQSPTIEDDTTANGLGKGHFISSIHGLAPFTRYWVRTYVTNRKGAAYGNQRTFSTLVAPLGPVLNTVPVTNVTQTAATSGGAITSTGISSVTARGVCWSSLPNPTTGDSMTTDGSGMGTFVSTVTGLAASKIYYLRAYATNSYLTSYGNEISFTTLPNINVPTVTTTLPSNITQITFTCGGNVTSDGDSPITARGVCWSTAINPTLADPHTNDGTGTGNFVSQIQSLQPNTPYFVKAYATNSAGTAYGNQVSCTTFAFGAPCPGMPTLTYGGQVYNTVQIGTQCWMKENLNIGTRIDGNQEQNNTGTKEKYCYNDLETNCDVYGGLYQWGEVVQYLNGASNTTSWNPVPSGNVQGLCPSGWHLPADAEWTVLFTYLGGESIAGGKMKEAGYIHWDPPNTGADNSSGFTGLPGGLRNFNGLFAVLGHNGVWWTAKEVDNAVAWQCGSGYTDPATGQSGTNKPIGQSVRCIKD